jgi:sugar phosphate isomerase/epimerase
MNKPLHRRKFLKLSSASALAMQFPRNAFAGRYAAIPSVALQLYTVRELFLKDIPGTLKKIAEAGIKTVETAFWPEGVTVAQAAKYIKDAGLNVCSCHVDIPLGDKRAGVLQAAEAFNSKRIIWHGWPEDKRYSSLDGTKELIEIYNKAGEVAKANGLQFGLHNHWWEFRNKVGGRFVYEWLLEGVSKDVFFELDTYWIKVAGHEPEAIVAKYGSRAKQLHMKDGPAVFSQALIQDKPDPMVALGKGTLNIPAITKAARANIEWMVIEMDVVAPNADVLQVIKESYDYLVSHQFAQG